jgi:DNA-binding LacI/PurR family transcriptional regulator
MTQPTQQGIARELSISQFTVSLALRNDRRISAATRKRVLAAAERLGYRADPLVSALMARVRRGRKGAAARGCIACLLVQPSKARLREQPSLERALKGARQRAAQLGFGWEEFWLVDRPLRAARLADVLEARGIHGVVLHPGEGLDESNVPALSWDRYACAVLALLDRSLAGFHAASIAPFRHVELALQQAVAAGARSAGLALPARYDRLLERLYSGAMASAAAFFPGLQVVPSHLPETWTRASFIAWWSRHRPDVVLTRSPEPLTWLKATNQGAKVFCLHLGWHEGLGSAWAGIDPCAEAVGAACADLVIEQLLANERGMPAAPKMVLVGGCWRPGASLPATFLKNK